MKKNILKTAYIAVTLVAVCGSLSAATYAWFSENKIVRTEEKVTVRTEEKDLTLLLSQTGGAGFKGLKEAALVSTSGSMNDKLMPVSTYDLKSFLYNPATVDGDASYFIKLEDDKYIYHGKLYIKAEAVNQPAGSKMALYLDEAEEAGGKLLQNYKGYMVNAARLGITFDGGNTTILRFSEENNPSEYQVLNTVINGQTIGGGYVLTGDASKPTAVKDPSVLYTDYVFGEGSQALNAKPIMYMELNREYAIDVYFYIEGCDPDCSDITQNDELDFHIGFFGLLESE